MKDFHKLLETAVEKEASDLHIREGLPAIYRMDGSLQKSGDVIKKEQIITWCKNLAGDIDNLYQKDLSYQLKNLARFRVNIYRQMNSFSMAIRIIPSQIPPLSTLNLPDTMEKLCKLKQGLVLVTGITGSGKSTTLASMVNEVNKTAQNHIITLEDPIEYIHECKQSLINQREKGAHFQKFSEGLSAAMRQDPDVILVGEMRDLETISTALTAAETGHLVLATLHTQRAHQSIDRMIDVFPPHQQGQIRIQLASTLKAVLTQQLVPKTYGGRTAVAELMECNTAIKTLIREGKTHQIPSIIQTNNTMTTFEKSLENLYNQGEIDEKTFHMFSVGG
ncbi:PilT/PilU family type 4a pilus ATPase [Proteinivorax hydrogeniformans]|uniref:PilT/PilU family type 4a pilus ATPase n=1 Tax=Proteinivorax hydrogeniformans TaxID=1826727 RepID=A0AAU8HRD2_9FIRM